MNLKVPPKYHDRLSNSPKWLVSLALLQLSFQVPWSLTVCTRPRENCDQTQSKVKLQSYVSRMCICVCVRQREIVSESMIVFHCIQSHLDLIIWFEFSIFSLQNMQSWLYENNEDEQRNFKCHCWGEKPPEMFIAWERVGCPDLDYGLGHLGHLISLIH